ncbi:hypothetical protein GOV11_01170 [Candidatus Woesearchaeota archaeon]|nr:hypothetical protein [Candidatus Woesearchaeota archaeon]
MAKPRRRVAKQVKPVDHEKKRQRRVLVIGLFMVALMLLSVSSVMFYNPSFGSGEQLKYGDVEFDLKQLSNGGSVLVAELNGQDVEFQNLPTQVGHLDVDPAAITLMQMAPQVGLVADPQMELEDASFVDYARLQLQLAMPGKAFNAMLVDDDRYSLPVMNCSRANSAMPLIIFNLSNESTSVTTDGYCISLKGSGREMMQLKDRIIFEYHGLLAQGVVVE